MGSIGSILTASIFLLFKERIRKLLIPCLISYSSGTLLAAAFLGMIPNAQSESDPKMILSIVLIGIVGFFLMEKMMIWRHCHKENCETHSKAGPIILIGDAFHNSIDGAVIASSFLISIPIGIAVSISVIAHEIPQEVGDFAILLEEKYSKAKAFFYNLLSSISTVPIGILSYYILEIITAGIPYVLALSASSFIYIALTDLYPKLHQKIGIYVSIRQIILILLGIVTIFLVILIHP